MHMVTKMYKGHLLPMPSVFPFSAATEWIFIINAVTLRRLAKLSGHVVFLCAYLA